MKIRQTIPSLFFMLFLTSFLFGCAQNSDITTLKSDITALKEEQAAMKKDLDEIKELLDDSLARRRASIFKPTVVDNKGAHFKGQVDAPITIVEFTDYLCPYCKRHALTTLPRILSEYVETGKLKYVIRENPLKQIHPQAPKLSEAALCAGEQNKYWEVHDHLFKNMKKPNIDELITQAESLGLNAAKFKSCLDTGEFAGKIEADLAEAARLGVKGTPSFILGKTDRKDSDKVDASDILRGALPYEKFKETIDKIMAPPK